MQPVGVAAMLSFKSHSQRNSLRVRNRASVAASAEVTLHVGHISTGVHL